MPSGQFEEIIATSLYLASIPTLKETYGSSEISFQSETKRFTMMSFDPTTCDAIWRIWSSLTVFLMRVKNIQNFPCCASECFTALTSADNFDPCKSSVLHFGEDRASGTFSWTDEQTARDKLKSAIDCCITWNCSLSSRISSFKSCSEIFSGLTEGLTKGLLTGFGAGEDCLVRNVPSFRIWCSSFLQLSHIHKKPLFRLKLITSAGNRFAHFAWYTSVQKPWQIV